MHSHQGNMLASEMHKQLSGHVCEEMPGYKVISAYICRIEAQAEQNPCGVAASTTAAFQSAAADTQALGITDGGQNCDMASCGNILAGLQTGLMSSAVEFQPASAVNSLPASPVTAAALEYQHSLENLTAAFALLSLDTSEDVL